METENQYYIIRGEKNDIFFGQIKERNGKEVEMTDVRRIWYWEGAATTSQLAKDGTSLPQNCKFTVTVASILLLNAMEIIPCTPKAVTSIKAVKEWTH